MRGRRRGAASAVWKRSLIALSAAVVMGNSHAQVEGNRLSGTLKKVLDTGVITLAYRESSIPFSFRPTQGNPVGYSIDLCRAVVDAVSSEIGRTVSITWLPVTSESRISAVVDGKADLECGSTTNNLERRKEVAFSPIMFVSGTKLMVPRGSPIHGFHDLKGRTVIVTAGTTNEAAMHALSDKFGLQLKFVVGRDHADSFAKLKDGAGDAFATDDVLLSGLIAEAHAQKSYEVIGEFLSYDPYGIMLRKDDPQFLAVVNKTFEDLAESGELEYDYNRWFLKPLPGGERMELPMSPQLEEIMRSLGATLH
ncbi:MAG: amino acid ABC transporter substrate-binding protein [Burkholderiaceae bacterium]